MNLITSVLVLGLLPWLICGLPLKKRALSANDTSVLQLALYLEHLEFNLYSGAYNSFSDSQFQASGFPAGFRENIEVIAQQEATHAALITQTLEENGVAPVPNCTYTFPYSSPTTFVNLANMITTVGIGAYLGGSTLLTDNTNLLTTAGSILTNEARHDAFLRSNVGASSFPEPFDISLTATFAYNLAQAFIVSCPQQLPITILPTLNLTSPMPPPTLQPPTPAGTTLNFAWDPTKFFVSVSPTAPLYIALINANNPPIFQQVTTTGTGTGSVPLPPGVAGVAFAVLTTFSSGLDENQLTSFGTLAGPAEVVLS